jgi:hypothetical protein
MKCLIWRQHRGQLAGIVAVLAAACLLVVLVARTADAWLVDYHRWLTQLRAAGCRVLPQGSGVVHEPAGCHALLQRYRSGEQDAFVHSYNFAIPLFEQGLPLVLVIAGVLIGAPMVAREVEQRTQLVAWTQSVARRRWYVTKVVVLAAGCAVTGLIAGLANDRVQIPLTQGGLTSSRWPWFFSIDLTPAAEIVLAFALAVALGAYLRRTLAAVGAALVSFLVLFLASAWAVRSLTPTSRAGGSRGLSDTSWLVGGGRYHPAGQYWPLQLIFVAILLLVACALLAAGWRATRPRNTV